MQIVKKVKVKQVITDKSRELLIHKFEQQLLQLEQENNQLLFEQKKMEQQRAANKYQISNKFQKEIDKRKGKQQYIRLQIDHLGKLPLHSEIIEQEVEVLVEVSVGMDWNQLMHEQAIVVKDGTVIRIDRVGEKHE